MTSCVVEGAGPRRASEIDSDAIGNNITALLDRVAGTSVSDIDRLVSELQALRAALHEQGARIQRDLAEYALLSRSTVQSTRVIAENLAHWRTIGDRSADTAGH